MALIKNTIYGLLAAFLFFSFIEAATRTALFVYTSNSLSFLYGFSDTVKVKILETKKGQKRLEFVNLNRNAGERERERERESISGRRLASEKTVTFAAFGGSATAGHFCGPDVSSWPEQLEKLISQAQFRVKALNFGRNGTNSDYAADILPFIRNYGPVNYVLWASFVNETDILSTGPERNLKALESEFGDILAGHQKHFQVNKYKIFSQRLYKTLEKYSLFYYITDKILRKVLFRITPHETNLDLFKNIEAKNRSRFISLVLKNYEINFLRAYDYCKENNIQLVLVREPTNTVFSPLSAAEIQTIPKSRLAYGSLVEEAREVLDNFMADLSNTYGIPLVNVQAKYQVDHVSQKSVFCDGAHQWVEGHNLMAHYVADQLGLMPSRYNPKR